MGNKSSRLYIDKPHKQKLQLLGTVNDSREMEGRNRGFITKVSFWQRLIYRVPSDKNLLSYSRDFVKYILITSTSL